MSLSIHQRLENMIRIGTIKTIHPSKPFMTVTVNLGEITTAKIRYLNSRSGEDQSWNPPSIGEEVIVFSPSGVLEMGVAFGALNNADHPVISEDLNKNITLFSDGCMISYDTKSHALEAILPDSGTAVLTALGGITINGDTKIVGNLDISGMTHSNGKISTNEGISASKDITAVGQITALGDIVSGLISLQTHTHSDVESGSSDTGAPK